MSDRKSFPECGFSTSGSLVSLPLVETAAQLQMFAQDLDCCACLFKPICCYLPGGLEYTTSLTREMKWVEGRKEESQAADLWEGGFPVQGSWRPDGGGEEASCASCKLALEGVVSEAFELRNKDPIVKPLTLDTVGVLRHFHLHCWAVAPSQHHPHLPGPCLAHRVPGLCRCPLSLGWECLK